MGKYRDALLLEGDRAILDPARILARINQDLVALKLDKYCTMVFGVLSHDHNRLTWASAGHYPSPVLIDGCKLHTLNARGRPIGLFEETGYTNRQQALPERFGLLVTSDGLLEVLPADSTRTRLQTFLNRLQPEPDLEAILAGFRLPRQEALPDDITLLLITRDPVHG
jgi:sigma-B regulation protein RsbU (phosphoserine phosphatase)